MIEFPVSGVETYWWFPVLVAFLISCLTSMGGVSGAFLILPFQISVLGFNSPAVSSTNLMYNVVAIPSGVYRYGREGRLVGPLVAAITLGTLPGVFIGVILRVRYLPDPRSFQLFAAMVLLYVAIKLGKDAMRRRAGNNLDSSGDFVVRRPVFSLRWTGFDFQGERYRVPTWSVFTLSFIVGIVGGTYGIGGGAIIAPIIVTAYRLPVHTIAGAALAGTLLTSVAGVVFYSLIAPAYVEAGIAVRPDMLLGGLFGVGGAAGMYVGARIQRFVPARWIKLILMTCMLVVVVLYVYGYFF